MAREKRGLQKDVSSIFAGVALEDVIHQALPQDAGQPAKPIPEGFPNTPFAAIDFPAPKVELVQEASLDSAIPQDQEAVMLANQTNASEQSDELSGDERVQQLMASVPCTKDHSCVQSNLASLCKAKLGRKGKVVQCMESKKNACSFRLSFLFKKICRCPLRQYIAKRWGK
jgi:hypothetical protein